MMSLLPAALRHCLTEPKWWEDELQGLHVVRALANLFGPVLIGPDCEIGPNASIFGPTVIEDAPTGPSVEIRRCLLLARAEVSHMSFLGHSVIGRRAALGAFFCSAVRNLRRGTVHVIRDGMLTDSGERRLGCVIADDIET